MAKHLIIIHYVISGDNSSEEEILKINSNITQNERFNQSLKIN